MQLLIKISLRSIHSIILICWTSYCLPAQVLDKPYIDNWVNTTFPHSVIDSNTAYVLNGYSYHADNIQFALKKFGRDQLIVIDFLDRSAILKAFHNDRPYSGMILLLTEGNQSKRIKRKILKKTLNFHADFANFTDYFQKYLHNL